MSHNVLTLEAFAEWCEKQPDCRYTYGDSNICAIGQYCKEIGVEYIPRSVDDEIVHTVQTGELRRNGFWLDAEVLANVANPRTFHGLAATIRKYI